MGLKKLPPLIPKISPRVSYAEPVSIEQARNERAPWRAWYSTARWRRLRWQTLLRDQFTCQCGCKHLEGDASKLVADHKRPHRGDPALFWDPDNLQTLRKVCHDSIKQKAEQSSLKERGVWY